MLKQAPATRFEELIVWQKSHHLTLPVYKITVTYPKHDLLSAYVRTPDANS